MTNVVNFSATAAQQVRYIDFPAKFEVGMRVYCGLYGGKDGTIIAIHGEQTPGTVRRVLGGAGVAGGSAYIDVAWDTRGESGGYSKRVPEGIVRGIQWKMLSGYRDPAEAIAEAEAFVAMEEAKASAAAVAFEKGKEAVKEKFSFLTVDDGTDRNIVQKNIRTLLKKEFPKVKFKVTKGGYSARRVSWVDGPTVDEVKKFTGMFEAGRFNGMEDIYEYDSTPFSEVFGSCQYVFESREYSRETEQKMIDKAWEEHHWVDCSGEPAAEKPSHEMYKKGSTYNLCIKGWGESFSKEVWKALSSASF